MDPRAEPSCALSEPEGAQTLPEADPMAEGAAPQDVEPPVLAEAVCARAASELAESLDKCVPAGVELPRVARLFSWNSGSK
jgi:hypothetical protein